MATNPSSVMNDIRAATLGACIETAARQPMMAITSRAIYSKISPIAAAKELYLKGGIGVFYSGFSGTIVGVSSRAFHRSTTYAASEVLRDQGFSMPTVTVATAACETATTMVAETFLTLAQTTQTREPLLTIVIRRVKAVGMSMFGSGFQATLGRNLSFNALYFAIPFYAPKIRERHPLGTAFIASGSAVVGSHFFEVLRVEKVNNPNENYRRIISRVFEHVRFRIIYMGMSTRMASVGLGSFIAMYVYNRLRGSVQDVTGN